MSRDVENMLLEALTDVVNASEFPANQNITFETRLKEVALIANTALDKWSNYQTAN